MKAPMLLPLLSLVTGILLATLGVETGIGLAFIVTGSFIYLFLNSNKSNPVKNYRYAPIHYCWIAFWFLGIGILDGVFSRPLCPDYEQLKNEVAAEGVVRNIKNSTSGDRLIIEITSLYNKKGEIQKWNNFLLLVYSDATTADIGKRVAIPFRDIQRIADSENTFQKGYAESLSKKGIFYSTRLPGKDIIVTGKVFSLDAISANIRDSFVAFIEKQSLNKDTRTFIITLLTGDKEFLDQDTRDFFADAGIAHVLALSGMHIGIISGIFLFILFPLNFFGKYKLRLLLTAILLWIYAFITGLSPSIVRACIMASALITTIILERKNTALNSLCLAGFIILLFSPYALFEIGFQLSFLCVGSLILFADRLNPIDRRQHRNLYNVIALIIATIITTFSSWIVAAYYFNRFPTMFLPTNILTLPFIPVYITVALIYLFCCLIGFEVPFLADIINQTYKFFTEIVNGLSQNSAIYLDIPGISVFLWLAGLILLYFFLYKQKKIFWGSASLLFFISSIAIIISFPPEKMEKGILICNSYPNIEIKYSDGEKEINIDVPVNALSVHNIKEKRIFVLDKEKIPDNVMSSTETIDYLIISRKYKGNISNLKKLFNPKKIVIHSSMRRKRENRLILEAESISQPIHSLRKNNALKIPL